MHYIAETLIADATAIIKKSQIQRKVEHKNLRGTLREEILIEYMHSRLPYFVVLGKGTIIDSNDIARLEGEDDIILYDQEITPPIKMYSKSTNGVFHYNGVLARIEVKSSLEAKDYVQFINRSKTLSNLKVDLRKPKAIEGAYNFLFAYDSKANKKSEFERFIEACEKCEIDPLSGLISNFCILGKGIYRLFSDNNRRFWQIASAEKTLEQQLVRFVAMISEMCLRQHIIRSGRDIEDSLEISIGNYLGNPQWEEV